MDKTLVGKAHPCMNDGKIHKVDFQRVGVTVSPDDGAAVVTLYGVVDDGEGESVFPVFIPTAKNNSVLLKAQRVARASYNRAYESLLVGCTYRILFGLRDDGEEFMRVFDRESGEECGEITYDGK